MTCLPKRRQCLYSATGNFVGDRFKRYKLLRVNRGNCSAWYIIIVESAF